MGDYSRLAALLGAHHQVAFFRRFATLNTKNLLYLQSELIHLEGELSNIALEDQTSTDPEKSLFHVSLFELKNSDPAKSLQWQKVLEARKKLK
ncbi:hypothetical protein MMC20_001254, partial [Loxospora ochrophaea]|nr:hypothetical protein [Loxospora ochrophaea]